MDNEMEMNELERSLKALWKDRGSDDIEIGDIRGLLGTDFIVGNRINQDIADRIICIFCSQSASDHVVNDDICIDHEGDNMFQEGRLVLNSADSYSFDEIGKTFASFLMDVEKNDSKSMLNDATMLLVE